MAGNAYERVREGQPMPGLILANRSTDIGAVIEDLLLALEASEPEEFENQLIYLPL